MTQRNFIRVPFTECASIKQQDQVFFGNIENISLQGMYIKTAQDLTVHSPVDVAVYFSPVSSFYLTADIVRRDPHGIGVQIKDIDIKSFVYLRDLVAKECNDHDLVLRETFKVTSCIH
ncbi:MAG TPA: PilZ domain-containing protein [Desulfuromonadales bacterium]|nr:PilZ domain-containing protein [Desulfuromonadales bacterium]